MLNNFNEIGKFGRVYKVIKKQIYSVNGDVYVTFSCTSEPFNTYIVKLFSELYSHDEKNESSDVLLNISVDKALQIFCRQHPVIEVVIV